MATPREQLADALRKARQEAGFTSHQQLARVLRTSRSVLSRAENPREGVPSDNLITAIADATNADLPALLDLTRRARSPRSFFAKWSEDFESRATMLRIFEPLLVPGLLQTESYARAVVSWKPFRANADANLSTRLARQSIVDRAELRMLILGTVLDREVGGPSVMDEQLAYLLNIGERESVTLQIVPDVPDLAGALVGAFAIATEGHTDTGVFTDSLIQSGVYTDAAIIERAVRVFDGLRSEALSWRQTREQLERSRTKWNGVKHA
jgi:transcriptional regulator with XRE-family HTH domain